MKKLSVSVFAAASLLLAAGTDLPIDGKFRQIKSNSPTRWRVTPTHASQIVGGEEMFSRALQLSAADNEVTAVTKRSFPVNINDEVELEAEIKGSGNAFLAVEVLNSSGKTVAVKRIATAAATNRFEDIKGSLRIRDYAQFAPAAIRIICGAEPESVIVFYDVDAELDRD